MKQAFCAIVLSMLSLAAISQSKVGEDRQTSWAWNFQEYEPSSKTERVTAAGKSQVQNIPEGSRFTIVDEITLPDQYIIVFWQWEKNATNRANINFESDGNAVKYFTIPKHELDVVSDRIYRIWSPSVGALTFPFKFRPQSGKFEPTFSIGISGGVTWNPWRYNEHTFSLLVGISASSARVDQYSTDPPVPDPSERAAVTTSLGFLYQWERLQIGISAGIDNLLDNEVLHWRYQGKGWISFGVGISLFSASEIKSPGKN